MRILHTADWHIGRTLLSHDMADDQRFAIEGVTEIARGEKVDAIVIAGDLYDRGNPSEESVAMLDEALERLCEVAPVLAIAGNHDSGPRLDFGRRRMDHGKLHLVGTCHGGAHPVHLSDRHGEVVFHLMPFAMPEQVRFALNEGDLRGHDAATARRIASIERSAGKRHVLVGHLFAQGGTVGDTERSIAVGGAECVDPAHFQNFHYVALGHLHRPHSIGTERIRYSGSLCRCSFSEEDHDKSVSIVELDAAGKVAIKEVKIQQRRGMRTITGMFDEVLDGARCDPRRDQDWIRVKYTDPTPIVDAMTRLRGVYPHIVQAIRERPDTEQQIDGRRGLSLDRDAPTAFLERFLSERSVGGEDDSLRRAMLALAAECLEEAMRGDRR